MIKLPAETLIGANIAKIDQGKVYSPHFAFSHVWWAIAYSIVRSLGTKYGEEYFLIGAMLSLVCFIIFMVREMVVNN